jgi:hypothetical protein
LHALTILPTQGGGHGGIHQGQTGGRPVIAKPLIQREASFYQKIRGTPLGVVVPPYAGTTPSWLLLHDLTAGMSSPCIADLKLGTRSYEVGVSAEKARRQRSHIVNTTTASHAIRCIDICIRKQGHVVSHVDRKAGREMSWPDFQSALRRFLPGTRMKSFEAGVTKLAEAIDETKEMHPYLRLYSASVLVLYDGDEADGEVQVFLIDFAHAYIDVVAAGGKEDDRSFDDNSATGLHSLLSIARSSLTSNSQRLLGVPVCPLWSVEPSGRELRI